MKTKVELDNKSILVTGGAGFIGASLILRLLKETTGSTIVNIDNVNDYYDVSLQAHRIGQSSVSCSLLPQYFNLGNA